MLKDLFKDYYRELLGTEEAEQFFSSIEVGRSEKKEESARSIRVNTLRISKNTLRKWFESQGYAVNDSPYSNEGLELKGSGQEWALKLPYHAGFTYPQDAASMFAVEVLNPQPDEVVLDLTAAPGGKSTHIAQRLGNAGVLVANDLDTRRIKALQSNLSRLGISNAYVTRLTPGRLAEVYPESFDRILLDPSCSGEGLFVTSEGQPEYWNKKALKHFSGLQFGLLRDAFRMLKPGGRLLYSTCTLNTVENDGVVEDFLEKTPEAKIDESVLKELKARKIKIPEQIAGLKGIRFWPHKTHTKGFFCIALTKTAPQHFSVPNAKEGRWNRREKKPFKKNIPHPKKPELKVLKAHERAHYDHFLEDQFGISSQTLRQQFDWVPLEHHLYLISNSLTAFAPPPGFSLSLPVLKTYGKDRSDAEQDMKPSHEGAVALGLIANKHLVALTKEQLEASMKNQTVSFEDLDKGMYLAVYEQEKLRFPIGLLKIGSKRTELLVPKMA
ncbi:RsmB/NOP family class I SAM-dependent RNA methyltransferase [Candidatus Peregrinibacteria bacterium]|nr:MAG: RsmB/NOP family class I SAM-dependent RNA methyltransferase [Candidatus Peregrinibacteria bacterium]